MPRRTLSSVERELRTALLSDHVTVKIRAMRDAGQIKGGKMSVDPFHGAQLDTVIHELLHFVYYNELDRWVQLEEFVVLALEEGMVRYINRSPRRVEWWRKSIDAKLD